MPQLTTAIRLVLGAFLASLLVALLVAVIHILIQLVANRSASIERARGKSGALVIRPPTLFAYLHAYLRDAAGCELESLKDLKRPVPG